MSICSSFKHFVKGLGDNSNIQGKVILSSFGKKFLYVVEKCGQKIAQISSSNPGASRGAAFQFVGFRGGR